MAVDGTQFFGSATWYSRKGAFLASIGIAFLISTFLATFTEVTGQRLSLELFALCVVVPILLFLFLVFIKRSWVGIRYSGTTTVVLAYNFDGVVNRREAEERYAALEMNLRNRLRESSLSKLVKVVRKHTDISFEDAQSAEHKTHVGQPGRTILLWGHAERVDGVLRLKTKVSYEYAYPKAIRADVARGSIHSSIQKALRIGMFGERPGSTRSNSLEIDDGAYANGSFCGILFIAGIISACYNSPERTSKLLEQFIKECSLDTSIRDPLADALAEAKGILQKIYQNESTRVSFDHNWTRLREVGVKQLQLGLRGAMYSGHLNLALSNWHEGERDNAILETKLSLEYASKDDYTHKFNFAFFNIWERNYEKMLSIYENLPKNISINEGFVIEHLGKSFIESGDPAFLFAEAYVNYKFAGLNDEAERVFLDFLRLTSARSQTYESLRKYAERAVIKLKETNR